MMTRLMSERRTSKRQLLIAVAILTARVASPVLSAHQQVDTQQSTITVRVFKAGFFRGFGDNHEIRGVVKEGSINDANPIEVHISVDARNLRVVDPDASANDRAQIQARMLGHEVLDASRFPEIRFDSDAADRIDSHAWIVHGQLDAPRPDAGADGERQSRSTALQRFSDTETDGFWYDSHQCRRWRR